MNIHGIQSVGTLTQVSGGFATLTGSFTGSFKGDGSGLTGLTASVSFDSASYVTTASFNSYTQSNDSKWNTLGTQSGSWVTSAITASSVVTASIGGNTITFTKGNSSTFDIVLPTGSVPTDITALNAFTASQIVSNSFFATTSSLNTLSASIFSTDATQSSLINGKLDTSSFSTFSQSVDSRLDGIEGAGYVTSTITGSVLTSASFDNNTRNLTFTKGDASTFSVNIPDASGSSGNFVTTSSFNAYTSSTDGRLSSLESATGSYTLTSSFNSYTSSTDGRLNSIESKTGSFATTGSNTFVGNQDVVGVVQAAESNIGPQYFGATRFQAVGDGAVAYDQFVNSGSYDALHIETAVNNGTRFDDYNGVSLHTWLVIPANPGTNPPPQFQRGLGITGSLSVSGSTIVSGNVDLSGNLTASLQQGYVWVGGAGNRTVTVATSSFGGSGASFPYTGSAIITGSLLVTGSQYGNVVALTVSSGTASLDMSLGNSFTLTLPSSSTTHINPTNIRAGATINLLITQPATSGAVSFPSSVKFQNGVDYQASATGSAIDLISFATFDTTNVYATAIKNLL